MRVAFVVTELGAGGAELVLERLVYGLRDKGVEVSVFSLTETGAVGEKLLANGVSVSHGSMQFPRPVLPALKSLQRYLRDEAPDIVQCWLPHGNVIGSLVASRSVPARVVLGIRSSQVAASGTAYATRALNRAGALTSRFTADALVACADSAANYHTSIGYPRRLMHVIPNGIDTVKFSPRIEVRTSVRAEWGVGDDECVVINVSRWDPLKGHVTLLDAMTKVAQPVRLVLAGRGLDQSNSELNSLIAERHLNQKVICVGETDDVPKLLSGADIFCLSSVAEGFPNAVAEAMSCAIPVVATDAGETAAMLEGIGTVVPVGDSGALAHALDDVIGAGAEWREARGLALRGRVIDRYSLPAMVDAYLNLYTEMLATEPRKCRGSEHGSRIAQRTTRDRQPRD